jgi:hypothetical protein
MPNPNGHITTLKPPWTPGHAPKAGRRSRDVEKTLKLARKHCPEAMAYAISVLRDPAESVRWRMKAAELILSSGMPKDPAAVEKFFGDSGGTAFIEVRFVAPGERSEPVDGVEARPNGNGTFRVDYDAG